MTVVCREYNSFDDMLKTFNLRSPLSMSDRQQVVVNFANATECYADATAIEVDGNGNIPGRWLVITHDDGVNDYLPMGKVKSWSMESFEPLSWRYEGK